MGKGELNGVCNRTACDANRNVVFYNKVMQKYYCPKCAKAINGNSSDPLCVMDDLVRSKMDRQEQRLESYVLNVIQNTKRRLADSPVSALMALCRTEGYLSGVRESNSDLLSEALYRELVEKLEKAQSEISIKITG